MGAPKAPRRASRVSAHNTTDALFLLGKDLPMASLALLLSTFTFASWLVCAGSEPTKSMPEIVAANS
jgi:hypothetical protein